MDQRHGLVSKVKLPSMHKTLGSRPTQPCIKLGVMMHACKSSILEVEAGVSEVQGQYWLHETSQEGQGKRGRKGGEGRGEEGSSFRVSVGLPGGRESTLQCYPLEFHS